MKRIFDWRFLVTLVVILALGWMIYAERRRAEEADAASLRDRAELRAQVAEQKAEVEAQKAASAALAEQLRQLGEKPAVEPSDPPAIGQFFPIPGPRGERGQSCIEQIGYPRCRGAAGDDSTVPGPAGAASTVPGPKGDKGDTGAAGADGKDGANGVDGKDGRGITDAQCGDDGRWDISWTDGTTTDGGLCRVAPGNSGENR